MEEGLAAAGGVGALLLTSYQAWGDYPIFAGVGGAGLSANSW